jgi:hypothetical protein
MVLAQNQRDQRKEDLEINSHSYSHLILDEGATNIYWKKTTALLELWPKW